MAKVSNSKQQKTSRTNERNFTLSDEALELVERAKQDGQKISKFVSDCIVNFGPSMLDGKNTSPAKGPTIDDRLRHLEELIIEWEYDNLIETLEKNKSIKEHQKILESTKLKNWYNKTSIKKILAAAKENPKTKDTSSTQWKTILRHRKNFLAKK